MKARLNGPWSAQRLEAYLTETQSPLRIAVNGDDFPLLCSVWFDYEASKQVIYCISHERSQLVKSLNRHPYCSFEISPNSPPYMGVRGRGSVVLRPEGGAALLTTLMTQYLGGTDSSLASWLLGRAREETTIEITPTSFTTWDFSARM